jgi:hypothetical protein
VKTPVFSDDYGCLIYALGFQAHVQKEVSNGLYLGAIIAF